MNEADFVFFWFRAFVVTLLVELVVLTPLLLAQDARLGRCITTVALAQLASHPVVWFVFPAFALSRLVYLGVAESWAVLVEASLYRIAFPSLSTRRTLLLSLAANAASVLVGGVLRHFGQV